MPRPERPLDGGDTNLLRFAADLRRLRERAGSPGYRELSRRAHFSATTLSEAASGRRVPSLAVTLAYVRACGGDVAAWEARWRELVADTENGGPAPDADDSDAGERPPYAGLAAFGPEDAEWYFGRERLVEDLLARRDRQRFLAVFGASGSGVGGQAPARVWFEVGDRCLSNCATRNATTWPDVPWDRECTSGTCAGKVSPTFWSTKRLTKITTQVSTGSGNYRDVDQWAFTHSFPPAEGGTTPALWLATIVHTGLAGPQTEPTVALPPVTFGGFQFPNRVDTVSDGLPALQKYRITSISNESGGDINVSYRTECAPGATPPADANTKLCFPVHWAAPLDTEPRKEFFHKYAVTKVSETDDIGGNVTQVTNYDYDGAGGAWAFDDNPLIPAAKHTWSEWRGYEKVVVRRGQEENKPESSTEHQFFRGMNRDIVDSKGTRTADPEQYAGFERETIVRNGVGGVEVSGEIHTPWSRHTATHATQASLKAHQVENVKTESRTRLSDGSYRDTRVETKYDGHGNPFEVNDSGDVDNTTDDRCTTTTYAKNLATMVVNLPSTVTTIGVACGGTPSFPDDAIADTRTYYDNVDDLGAAPTKGDVTKTEVAKDYAGSQAVYLHDKRAVYDAFGRVRESYDALQRKTTTDYAEEHGLTKTITETNPKTHVKTTTLDPAWGLPTTIVDANNRVTSLAYDALGRLTGVWKPGRSKDALWSPHLRYTYQVRNTAVSWVKTEKLNANENHVATFTLLDGFLRERQTQAPSPQGGRILTDTLYDSRGLVNVTRAPYYNKDTAPGTSLFLPNAGEVPNAAVKVYDGAERETDSIYLKLNVEQWRTRTYHGGDRVSVVPPAGGTATTTISDARGRTTELLQYKTRPASGPPTGPADRTTYGYTKRGDLASITDPAGNVWRNTYDVLGRRKTADDPDKGVTVMTYDDAGQLLTTTDARGKTVTIDYDVLGRKTQTRIGTTLLTKMVYDTPENGALKSATRYSDGKAYVRTVDGWDDAGRPTGETVTIPYVEAEKELAGTYQTTMTYAWDGSPLATTRPALGDLPRETLNHGYDGLGLPNTLEGAQEYVTKTTYTALGEPTQTEYGAEGKRVWRTSYYEEGTRRPERVLTEREQPNGIMVHELTYTYDQIGNVTRIGDRTAGQTTDTQCFRYDYLRRATEAWTATDDCATAPSGSVIGGPAPYWHQFGYDLIGNRRTHTKKGLDGTPDTLSTYTYPAPGDGVDRPHGVTSIQTGPTTTTYAYDAAGNTTGRPGPSGQQTLTWTDDGLLESITSATQSTRYLYDADGKQLLRRDKDSITLFVGNGELKLNTTTRTKTGTRYYDGMGTRTAAGLTWTVADHHGTPQVAIDSTTLAATPRRLDLFGNPRGGSPAAASTWPGGTRGFVGGTPNPATGLTRLGAREYDPATGKFLSVDPLIDPNDPQQINAYSYGNNNPATLSDPDGLRAVYDDERDWNWGAPTAAKPRPCGPPFCKGPSARPGYPRKGNSCYPHCPKPPKAQRPAYPRKGNNCYPNCPKPPKVQHPSYPRKGNGCYPNCPRIHVVETSPKIQFNRTGYGQGLGWLLYGLGKLFENGGSVSLCAGGTAAAGGAIGVEVCVAFDSEGLGVSVGRGGGAGPAYGIQTNVSVKVSTAMVDELGGGSTYVTTGRMTHAVFDDGNVSTSLSVPIRGTMTGNHGGRGDGVALYVFRWDWLATVEGDRADPCYYGCSW